MRQLFPKELLEACIGRPANWQPIASYTSRITPTYSEEGCEITYECDGKIVLITGMATLPRVDPLRQ